MKNEKLQLRMYMFTPYNLSPIQKGIQAGHAALEYARLYGHMSLFQEFVKTHKTWIILDGGTTRDNSEAGDDIGTMNQIVVYLQYNKIQFATFREPDLNFALTGICFICDERVFDREEYEGFEKWCENKYGITLKTEYEIRLEHPNLHDEWLEYLGGYKNFVLRLLISDKKLAA